MKLDGKISVIMPAYNEARYIESNVQETVETLSSLGYDFEVIVVDDGSPDDTYIQAVRACSLHQSRVRVVRYDVNRGKGSALICGTTYATGQYIVFLDSDMDLHPAQLPVLFDILIREGADAVIGSKRHPLSNVDYPLVRRIYSIVYFALVRILFGLPLRDTQTGLKVFHAALLKEVFPRVLVKRFAFDIELLTIAHRRGYKIVDAPVTLTFQRKLGRIRIQDILVIFRDTLAIFYRMKILKYYDTHVDVLAWADDSQAREVFAESAV